MRITSRVVQFACLSIVAVMISGCGGEKKKDGDNKNSSKGGNTNTPNTGQGNQPSAGTKRNASYGDRNLIKMLAIAMHNYHDTFKQFPTSAKMSEQRHGSLSWRVAVLPFAEGHEVWKKMDVKKPADDPVNQAVVAEGKAPFALSNGSLISGIRLDRPVGGLRDVVDGSSNTIMLIENPNVSPDKWIENNDLTVDEAIKLIKSLKSGQNLLVAFYDGSMFPFPSIEGKNVSDDQLKFLFDPRDGQQIDIDQIMN